MIKLIILSLLISASMAFSSDSRFDLELLSSESKLMPSGILSFSSFSVNDAGERVKNGVQLEYDPAAKSTLVSLYKNDVLLAIQYVTGGKILKIRKGVKFERYESDRFLGECDWQMSSPGKLKWFSNNNQSGNGKGSSVLELKR